MLLLTLRPRHRMCVALVLLAWVMRPIVAAGQAVVRSTSPVVELRGARWFDGTTFVGGSRWMRDGQFVSRPTQPPDSVVDLRGRFMVPPYADAHTHSPDSGFGFEAIRDTYLRLGVFYVQPLTNSRAGRREIAARVNVPASVDVAYADGAVTSSGGHPQVLYESLGLYRRFWQVDSERVAAARSLRRDGDVYHRLDSLPQLAAIVTRLARDTVPVLKVMLLDSERWTARHADSTQYGFYGMNPALLPALVDAAHGIGRRVWAHVETPYDMEIALRAGVDGFAHVPGYGAPMATDSVAQTMLLPDSTIELAGRRRVLMTATLVLSARQAGTDSAALRRLRDVTVRNAGALQRAGVTLLAGSDTYSDAGIIRDDPATTARLLGFSPLQELRLMAVTTPTAIFPTRRIGRLAPGYDASALALSCNPLQRRECLHAITMRLKQGAWLTVPDAVR